MPNLTIAHRSNDPAASDLSDTVSIEHANGARTFVFQVAKEFRLQGDYKERWADLFDLAQDQYSLRANLPVTESVRGLLMRAVDEYIAERGV